MKLPWRDRRPFVNYGPPISTSLTDAEATVLRNLARGVEVLEVGSAHGYSTVVMGCVARRLVTVDHHLHLPDSLDILHRNIREYALAGRVEVLVGHSPDILTSLPDGSFDGAFIDGDHSRAGVIGDATHALRMVRHGGWLAFHDWDEDTCPEVRPALEEFFAGRLKEATLTDTLLVIRRP